MHRVNKTKSDIDMPHPELNSWMHERIVIPKETEEEKIKRYKSEHPIEQLASSLISKLFKITHILRGKRRFTYYRLTTWILYRILRLKNKICFINRHKIPKNGAIFIINHIAGQEVVMPFLAAFRKPVGVFTTLGNGYLADLFEKVFGWVSRRGKSKIMIEKMIRSILQKNSYFVIWPEGTLERNNKVMQGFSGIVKVYATLNSKKNIIPFVPIYMKESKGREQILYYCLDPVFIPREWLKHPNEGGKTPREIIDYVMMFLARIKGQRELDPNHVLEHRKKIGLKPWK